MSCCGRTSLDTFDNNSLGFSFDTIKDNPVVPWGIGLVVIMLLFGLIVVTYSNYSKNKNKKLKKGKK